MITGAAQMDGAILVGGGDRTGRCRRQESTYCWRDRWECQAMVVFMNKVDAVDDAGAVGSGRAGGEESC
jgi:translation elongation factor EF-Tu-like GTPase